MTIPIAIHADTRAGDCPHFWIAIGCDEAHAWTLHRSDESLLADIKGTRAIKWIHNHHGFSSPSSCRMVGAAWRVVRDEQPGQRLGQFHLSGGNLPSSS